MKIFSSLSIYLKTSQNASHCVYIIICSGATQISIREWISIEMGYMNQKHHGISQTGVKKIKNKFRQPSEPVFFKSPLASLLIVHITSLNIISISVFPYSYICLFESLNKISVQGRKLLCNSFFKVWVKLFLWQQYNKKWKPWRNDIQHIQTHTRNLSPRNESRFASRQGCAVVSVMSSIQFLKQRIWWFPRETAQPQCLSIFKDYHSGLLKPTLFPLIHWAASPISHWQACSLFNNRELIKY